MFQRNAKQMHAHCQTIEKAPDSFESGAACKVCDVTRSLV